MYKLIALDMDGTLLRDDKTISPAVKEAISKAKSKGVKVVLSTGRPINGINRYLKELNLLEDGDIASSFNGGLVLETKSENVIYQCHMPNRGMTMATPVDFGRNIFSGNATTDRAGSIVSFYIACFTPHLPPPPIFISPLL